MPKMLESTYVGPANFLTNKENAVRVSELIRKPPPTYRHASTSHHAAYVANPKIAVTPPMHASRLSAQNANR